MEDLESKLVLWKGKLPHFAEKHPEIVSEVKKEHGDLALKYYEELFEAGLTHYEREKLATKSHEGAAELARHVAHGTLIAYAAHKILELRNV